jgi:hypothetical protein
MITDFKDPAGFISKLCSILIDELDKAPDSPAVWFALDKDKNVLDIGETVKNIRDSLGGSQNKMQKLQEKHDYSIAYIAYLLVDAKDVKNRAKKYKRSFKQSLKQNKSKIFAPAIKSLIKEITTTETKTAINTQAKFAVNFLRNTEKTEQGINVLSLEEILLYEVVNKEIFKEFIKEIIRLWQFYKEYPDDATFKSVLAVLDDSEKKRSDKRAGQYSRET